MAFPCHLLNISPRQLTTTGYIYELYKNCVNTILYAHGYRKCERVSFVEGEIPRGHPEGLTIQCITSCLIEADKRAVITVRGRPLTHGDHCPFVIVFGF